MATGAQAIRLPLAGDAASQVLSVNSLDDFAAFHARLTPGARVLIGGLGTVLGSLVDASAGTRIKALIDGALGKGEQLVVGGQLDGSILQQTLLDGVDETMSLYHEESFGPVAVMLRGEGDEALLRTEMRNEMQIGDWVEKQRTAWREN